MPDDQVPKLSEIELGGIAGLGLAAAAKAEATGTKTPEFVSQAAADAYKREQEAATAAAAKQQHAALEALRSEVDGRMAEAYAAGARAAVDRADRNNWNARSITLYLVVLAVVIMPVIAMTTKLSPQTFGSYIAPVTGIAGTVVGYWFGTLDRPGGRDYRAAPGPPPSSSPGSRS
ncbi:MAG TPA: hypothetical protein VMB74_09930 [Streptosporangiaceae bacterium]|nr:hypothetical protein [Streptosporangiaceae bacterium]